MGIKESLSKLHAEYLGYKISKKELIALATRLGYTVQESKHHIIFL